MNTLEIKNKFDALLKQLSAERSFDVAEKVTAELVGLLNIKVTDRFLVNLPRVDAELTRFQLAPGFARQAAAYELPHEDDKPVDLKLFWTKKASKTNLSWLIGLTPNFEDALSNDYKNMGIDFVVPETCDSVIVLLSNRFKIRALELKDHITPTQLEIFAQWAKLSDLAIADKNELKSTLHAKLWESFNFEPINRKFYLELVEHFSILVHHLEKDLGRKPSVMFTTRLIGRLLFIWFLKKKNLINTNVDYFSVPDPENQAEYYKSQLEKLFFEVLNRDELERNNGDKLTPYLNGGLFDKSTTDFCDDPKLTFPNGYFNQLFTTLNKYNFTVDESSPEFQHVAIDPEMLGRIFESLLAEQIDENTGNSKKKVTGAFYTPREIVSYMCEQSLIEYLKTKVPETLDRDRRIDELVRMPEAIFRDQDQNKRRDWKPYREAIIKALGDSKTESPLTVLDPAVGSGAFPMGMLHLLVKVYSRLDPKFEKDISGLKRDILSRSLYGVDIEQTAIEITRLRAWLSIIVDIPEGEKVEPLPNLEFKFVCANTLIPLDNNEQATFFTDHDFKDKLINIRDDYFRTSSKAKKEKLQKDYLKLTQSASLFDNKKTQQLKSYKPFDISSSSEFYDPELMHGVQAFDVIIGNPPYVDYRKIDQYTKDNLINFKVASCSRMINLYNYFFEIGINLLAPYGILTYISPQQYLILDNCQGLRDLIRENRLLFLADFARVKIFEASTYTFVSSIKKEKSTNVANYLEFNQIENLNSPVRKLLINNPIPEPVSISAYQNLLNKIEDIGIVKLDSIADIFCASSSSSLKFGDESEMCQSFITASDIKNWYIEPPTQYVDKNSYSTQAASKQRGPVIYTSRMTNSIRAVFINDNNFLGGKVNVVKVDLNNNLFILSILNSKLINFWYREKYSMQHMQGGALPINTTELKKIPLVLNGGPIKEIELLADQILTLKKQNKDADTKNLESQIDQLVYKLYDLAPEEIKIIESSSNK